MENDNQVLAVWGSPGSGKTTLSVKIAKELQTKKHSVAIVLCDDVTPSLPILLPNSKLEHRSLGDLLSQPRISQAEILKFSIPYGSNNNISLLGYCVDENPMSYPEYSTMTAKSLISALSRLVDNIIVDCSSDLVGNPLTMVALEVSDATLRVVNASLKSTVYMRSQQQLLVDSRFRLDRQHVVLNNVLPGQDENAHASIVGDAEYLLPHCSALAEQYETGKLADSLFGREAKHYEPVVKKIMKDVFGT
jgi:MinD-like ATPase involved in chromosome partitioning or flagellar assembly